MNLINVNNLNFHFNNNKVLDNINININSDEFCVITGPNGSGKSTLLKLILNILEGNSGEILVKNENIKKIKSIDLAKTISYVKQNFYETSNLTFTVKEIIEMGRYPYKSGFFSLSKEDRDIIDRYIQFTNLWDIKDRQFCKLSGGEKQRVIITKALVQDTDIIVLDEPLANLDMYYRVEFMELLTYLNKNLNKTVIIVLHDINLTIKYAKRIILMEKGKIKFDGDKDNIIKEKILEDIYKLKFDIIENEIGKYIFPKKNQFNFKFGGDKL
ncbi:MAG: ABC transporter ATP-binding protein [Fusobacteria bacterium]|nr:ABC transporter ATP-binding protein [Fusobacteriota bacterium]